MSLCATYNTNLRERASHMMRIFSWAAMATLAIGTGDLAGAELPIWRGPAEPHKFIDSVGRRAVLMGHEDGTFEAWIMPVKVLRDFRMSVYFDGSLEPVPLADLAESISVRPGQVTITHAHCRVLDSPDLGGVVGKASGDSVAPDRHGAAAPIAGCVHTGNEAHVAGVIRRPIERLGRA